MTVPHLLAGFDVPAAVERMLGSSSLWWQAVDLFARHFAGWETEWRASIDDRTREVRCVHALGSGAANIGAVRLSVSARALEVALRRHAGDGNETELLGLRDELRRVFRETLAELAEALDVPARELGNGS